MVIHGQFIATRGWEPLPIVGPPNMVKVEINDAGVTQSPGSGCYIGGRPLQDAAFDLRWTDLFSEVHEGTGASALTYEAYRNTGFFMRFFRHNQADKTFMVY